MADNLKKVLIPVPPPKPSFVKLKVLKDLRAGNVFYTAKHEVEVFHHEAVALLDKFPEYFEVITEA